MLSKNASQHAQNIQFGGGWVTIVSSSSLTVQFGWALNSCSTLTEMETSAIFCCCSTFSSSFNVLCMLRCFPPHHGYKDWLYNLKIISFLAAWPNLTILRWPLLSTRRVYPQNCHSLNEAVWGSTWGCCVWKFHSHSPLFALINKTFCPADPLHKVCSCPFCANSTKAVAIVIPLQAAVSEIFKPAYLAPTTKQLSH